MTATASPVSWLMKAMHGPVYAARLRELLRQIIPQLRAGDRVLDVGCGSGLLGQAILKDPGCPAGIEVRGLERVRRGDEAITVDAYDGTTFPYPDKSFDVVLLADVLHHEADPDRLIDQCIRVSRRLLIIKDHQRKGILAQQRISLIDWAANAPYGVPCLYRYNTPEQWRESHRHHHLTVEREMGSMQLYPPVYNLFFGRGLQYFAVLGVPGSN